GMSVVGSLVLGVVLVAGGSSIIGVFVGEGEQRVVDMAAHYLLVNGVLYGVLGVLFVLRGGLQGLGQTVVPTMTGVVELVCRVGAAGVLGAAYGYSGVVWGNPLAWIGAVILLVPAYVVAQRRLALQPVTGAGVEVLEGPAEGSAVMEAVVPRRRITAMRRRGVSARTTRRRVRVPSA
ncbi:MAG: MATE family efflux transporter, partial [Cellulomonas sp.]